MRISQVLGFVVICLGLLSGAASAADNESSHYNSRQMALLSMSQLSIAEFENLQKIMIQHPDSTLAGMGELAVEAITSKMVEKKLSNFEKMIQRVMTGLLQWDRSAAAGLGIPLPAYFPSRFQNLSYDFFQFLLSFYKDLESQTADGLSEGKWSKAVPSLVSFVAKTDTIFSKEIRTTILENLVVPLLKGDLASFSGAPPENETWLNDSKFSNLDWIVNYTRKKLQLDVPQEFNLRQALFEHYVLDQLFIETRHHRLEILNHGKANWETTVHLRNLFKLDSLFSSYVGATNWKKKMNLPFTNEYVETFGGSEENVTEVATVVEDMHKDLVQSLGFIENKDTPLQNPSVSSFEVNEYFKSALSIKNLSFSDIEAVYLKTFIYAEAIERYRDFSTVQDEPLFQLDKFLAEHKKMSVMDRVQWIRWTLRNAQNLGLFKVKWDPVTNYHPYTLVLSLLHRLKVLQISPVTLTPILRGVREHQNLMDSLWHDLLVIESTMDEESINLIRRTPIYQNSFENLLYLYRDFKWTAPGFVLTKPREFRDLTDWAKGFECGEVASL